MVEITWQILATLFLTGLVAGFVDSIAGGGGLVALPMLLSVGLPAHLALGTNKLQGTFGTLSASVNFIRQGQVNLKDCRWGIAFTFAGAALGTWSVQQLEPGFIRHLIPILLAIVLVYTFFAKNLGYTDLRPKIHRFPFFLAFGLGLGFYDGFFGPGTGSFWMAGLCILLGYNMKKAAGFTRIMNFTSNIVALSVFIMGGQVVYSIGLCMGAGQLLGARLGSNLAISKGAGFIRPVFMTVVALTIGRLVYLNYF